MDMLPLRLSVFAGYFQLSVKSPLNFVLIKTLLKKLRHLKNHLSPSRKGAKTLFHNQFANSRLCVSRTFRLFGSLKL
jgi:hypothetical protein